MSFFIKDTVEGNSFVCSTGFINVTTTSETVICLLRNPSGNSKKIVSVNLIFGSDTLTDIKSTARVYQNPTIQSNTGTSLIPSNMHLESSNTSSVEFIKQPNATSLGTFKFMRNIVLNGASNGFQQVMVIPPGKSILVTVQNSSLTGAQIHLDVNWLEIT